MTDLKDKRVLIWDRGLWPSLAVRFAESFGQVDYFCEWRSVAPKLTSYLVGTGLPNVRRVRSFWDALRGADLVVFPDVNDGDLQAHVESQGKPVFGCKRADELEIYRWESRQVFKKLGLDVPRGTLVNGLNALREHLQKVEDKWIKISVFRGDVETFHHETFRLSESTLDDWARKWGPAAEQVEFIVDDPIDDAEEFGYDGGFSNGQWWPICMYGPEIKDGAYVGKVVEMERLPEPLQVVNDALTKLLSAYDYCGMLSTEVRVRKNGQPILMELTCRMPSPPGELELGMWTNFPEMVYSAAVEKAMDIPEPRDPFGAEIMLYSDWSDDHWTALDIPDAVRPFTKLSFSAEVSGFPQIVPQKIGWGKAGGVIGFGKTLKKACDECAARVPLIRGKGIEGNANALDDAEEVIARGRKSGVSF